MKLKQTISVITIQILFHQVETQTRWNPHHIWIVILHWTMDNLNNFQVSVNWQRISPTNNQTFSGNRISEHITARNDQWQYNCQTRRDNLISIQTFIKLHVCTNKLHKWRNVWIKMLTRDWACIRTKNLTMRSAICEECSKQLDLFDPILFLAWWGFTHSSMPLSVLCE